MDMSLTQDYECQEDRVVGLVAALKFWISQGAGGESVIFDFCFTCVYFGGWDFKMHLSSKPYKYLYL